MLKPKPGIQHRNLVAVHLFYPCTINVVHHLRVFMPHLIGYKRRVCASRQEPAGKSMPRMVRIPAANAIPRPFAEALVRGNSPEMCRA